VIEFSSISFWPVEGEKCVDDVQTESRLPSETMNLSNEIVDQKIKSWLRGYASKGTRTGTIYYSETSLKWCGRLGLWRLTITNHPLKNI
jgi:hypothetical protein